MRKVTGFIKSNWILGILLIAFVSFAGRSLYTTVEADRGTAIAYQNDTAEIFGYDDFKFTVGNFRINPLTSKPDYEFNNNEYLFDKATKETISGSNITDHSFKDGAGIIWYPHVHWTQTDTGKVVYRLKYKVYCGGEQEPALTVIDNVNLDDVFPYVSGEIHQISPLPPITLPTYNSTACRVIVNLTRVGDTLADTYDHDLRFGQFDFHVPKNQSRGSRTEFVK